MMYRKTPGKQFPSLITVFSAPNYLDMYRNKGAVIKYKNKTITIRCVAPRRLLRRLVVADATPLDRQYNWTSHPYWLPNFIDAFAWSLPFVGSKILEMLLGVLAVCTQEELEAPEEGAEGVVVPGAGGEDEPSIVPPHEVMVRRQEIKSKIMAVGKMRRLYALLREEAEGASELVTEPHPPTPGGAGEDWVGGFAPPSENDRLGAHGVDIRQQIRSFDDARHADIVNERLPQFTPPPGSIPIVPAPSMWVPRFAAAAQNQGAGDEGESDVGNMSMESYIRRMLEEEVDSETAEKLAEKLARSNFGSVRPRGLRRSETT